MADDCTLAGREKWPEAGVVMDCRAASAGEADALAAAVVEALGDLHRVSIAGKVATFYRSDPSVADRGDVCDIWRWRVGFRVQWR